MNTLCELPAPLVPCDVDLQCFPYMPLDVRRLRDSDLAALESPEACWAAVLLWAASWHQVPAASLPDDDKVLANLAGYGKVVKEWKKIRQGSLRSWVKCSDGRLYHPVVADKAKEAWESKFKHGYAKLLERLRKENKKREGLKQSVIGVPTFAQWKNGEFHNGIPSDEDRKDAGTQATSAGIPAESAEIESPFCGFPPEDDSDSAGIPAENMIDSGGRPSDVAGIPRNSALNITEQRSNREERDLKQDKETRAKRAKPVPTSLPNDFAISDQVGAWASEHGCDRLQERLEHFIGYAKANGKVYVDWDQAFMNAIRGDWAKFSQASNSINGKAYKAPQAEPAYVRAGFGSAAEAAKAAAKAKEIA